jgi:hypothetical protein
VALGKRRCVCPGEAPRQLIDVPVCALRWFLLIPARVDEPTALPTKETAAREVQLDHTPPATNSANPRAKEILAGATELARHADDRDDLGHIFPFSILIPLLTAPGKTQLPSLSAQVD